MTRIEIREYPSITRVSFLMSLTGTEAYGLSGTPDWIRDPFIYVSLNLTIAIACRLACDGYNVCIVAIPAQKERWIV